MTEYKTLRELDVQPGDVVRHEDGLLRTVADINNSIWCETEGGERWFWGELMWTIISRAADKQEQPVYKTLRELDVQPGDTVWHEDGLLQTVADIDDDDCCKMTDGSFWFWDRPMWTIISRAEASQPYSGDEPILLRDMTAEQIGLLMQASFAGKVIEFFGKGNGVWISTDNSSWWSVNVAYRVRPEPTSVDLIADGRVVGAIEMEDGKINPTSAVWEDRG